MEFYEINVDGMTEFYSGIMQICPSSKLKENKLLIDKTCAIEKAKVIVKKQKYVDYLGLMESKWSEVVKKIDGLLEKNDHSKIKALIKDSSVYSARIFILNSCKDDLMDLAVSIPILNQKDQLSKEDVSNVFDKLSKWEENLNIFMNRMGS